MKHLLCSGRAIHFLLSILLLSLLSSFAIAQNGKSDLYAVVPDFMRASFVRRLNLMIEAMRSERYEEVYDLLAKYYTQDESRESFVRRLKTHYSKNDKFIDFVPEEVGSDAEQGKEPTQFIVIGCLKMREKGHKIKVSASVNVYAEDGNLYFSKLGPLRTLDGKYIPCPED
jgi:hypothetical protein